MRVSRGFPWKISDMPYLLVEKISPPLVHPDRLWQVWFQWSNITSLHQGEAAFVFGKSPRKQTRWCFCWMSIGVKDVTVTIPILGGDFKFYYFLFLDGETSLFLFNPRIGGNDPIWRAYFLNGLVQPPTRCCFQENFTNQLFKVTFWSPTWRSLILTSERVT